MSYFDPIYPLFQKQKMLVDIALGLIKNRRILHDHDDSGHSGLGFHEDAWAKKTNNLKMHMIKLLAQACTSISDF